MKWLLKSSALSLSLSIFDLVFSAFVFTSYFNIFQILVVFFPHSIILLKKKFFFFLDIIALVSLRICLWTSVRIVLSFANFRFISICFSILFFLFIALNTSQSTHSSVLEYFIVFFFSGISVSIILCISSVKSFTFLSTFREFTGITCYLLFITVSSRSFHTLNVISFLFLSASVL